MANRAQDDQRGLAAVETRGWRADCARLCVLGLLTLCSVQAAAQTAPPGPATPSTALSGPSFAEPVSPPGNRIEVPADYWDPPVITPTGQPSRVSESPSTTFVITGEEVRHAGATTIPELLRRVPGIDVRLLGATDGQIGPRGFAFEVADRVLVMVDGRTAYVDFFGGTAYEMLPVSPLDIDRIEVVLGPGASVYGNKAMLGTLNIITRSAAAFPGPEARVDAGPPGDVRAAVRDGIVAGNWRGRVTGLFRRYTPYPVDGLGSASHTTPSPAGGGTATLGYAPSPSAELSLEAGAMTGNTYLLPTGSTIYSFDSTLAYARADGRISIGGPGSPYGDLHVKAVCNFGWLRSSGFPPVPPSLNAAYQTPYAEISHDSRYRLGAILMQARWGAEGRLNLLQDDDHTLTREAEPIWNLAGFASDEAVIGRWRVMAGVRIDHQTLTNLIVSPRASVVFSPTPAHQLRVAFNSGYNNPSLIQNFAFFRLAGSPPLLGNRGLLPEQIYYGELAYGGTIARWLRLFANGFVYRMTNSITVSPTMTPTGTPALEWTNSNAPANAYGGEAGFEVAPTRTISGYANYAYLHLSGGPYSQLDAAQMSPANLGSPVNKVTAGLRLDLPKHVYVTTDGQYFGAAAVARLNDAGTPAANGSTPVYWTTPFSAYVIVHARAGVVFENGVDISIAGANLLNQTEAQLLGAQNPRRRVMATIAYTP